MIKYFCDKCGIEIKKFVTQVPAYAYDGLGNVIVFAGNYHLCEKCTEKFNMVKDQLKHEEDFFND